MSWNGKPVHSVYDQEKGVWIANKMDGTPGADPLALSGGGQRQVFRSLFVRRVLFIPDRMVQPDLQAVEQAVYTAQRD